MSSYEGKTRVYRFHRAFPLMNELEQMLKKIYTQLPAEEKKQYYVLHDRPFSHQGNFQGQVGVLLRFWERLSHVSQLTVHAKSKEPQGWSGYGSGEVLVTKDKNSLVFNEEGLWKGRVDSDVHFSNVFRWVLDRSAAVISLEHLRRGAEHPVFLFHLAPSSSDRLSSVDSHLCEGDSYFGRVSFDRHSLWLSCRVIGPKKDEQLDYYYS